MFTNSVLKGFLYLIMLGFIAVFPLKMEQLYYTGNTLAFVHHLNRPNHSELRHINESKSHLIQDQTTCSHIAYAVNDFFKCDKDNDHFEEFSINLATLESKLVRNQTGLTVTYHNAGGDLIDFSPGTQIVVNQRTIIARVSDVDGCYKETSFKLTLVSPPAAEVRANVLECEQYILPSLGPYSRYYTGINGTGRRYYEGNIIRSSTMLYIFAARADCWDESSFSITIDPSICEETVTETIYEFPKFFTPNGDNRNDVWTFDNSTYPQAQNVKYIEIYDRYGSLIKKLDPDTEGWDGNIHGRPLPSSDYWFRALTFDKKEIKGHFSLKR